MLLKRILLIVLLVFAIASLFIIVFFARNRLGIFSKSLESHLSNQTVTINSAIVSNLSEIGIEVKSLAGEKLVKNVFFSQAMGDDVRQYQPQFEDIRKHIKSCTKIQVVDRSGTVYYSTLEDEIVTKKIKESLVLDIKKHFLDNIDPYFYFLNKNDFISIFPTFETLSNPSPQGYVLIYYKTDRLLNGIDDKSVVIPFSVDNNLVLASKNVDTNAISKIINYYNTDAPQKSKDDLKGKPIGVLWRVMGLKIIHMEKSDYFLPWQAILFIIINIILIGLLIFALVQTRKEAVSEDYYIPKAFTQKEQYERMSRDFDDEAVPQSKKFNVPSNDEIQDLVEDIEKNETYNGFAAKKGIEDMIMSSSDSLTELPGYTPEPRLRGPFGEEPAATPLSRDTFGSLQESEEESAPSKFEAPKEMGGETEEWESSETIGGGEEIPVWETPGESAGEPSFGEMEDFSAPSPEASSNEMFAEQERILGGMEDQGEFAEIPAPEEFSFDQPTPGISETEPVFDMLPESDHDLISESAMEPQAESLVMEVPVSEIEPHMEEIREEELPASEEIDFNSIKTDEALSQVGDMEDSIVSFDESAFDQAIGAETQPEESFPILDESTPPVVGEETSGQAPDLSLTDIGQESAPEFDLGEIPEFEIPSTVEEPEEIILDNYGIQTEPTVNEPLNEEIPGFEFPETASEDLSQYEVAEDDSNGLTTIDLPRDKADESAQFEVPIEPEMASGIPDEFEVPLEPEMESQGMSNEIPDLEMPVMTPAAESDEIPAFDIPEPEPESAIAPNDDMIEDMTSGMEIPEIDIDSMISGVPDAVESEDDDSITLDPNELAALDVELDSEVPAEPSGVEEPLLESDFDFNEPEPLPESGEAPLSAQPEFASEQDLPLPEGQEIPEFDLDAMIQDVPSVESVSEDDDSITLDPNELSAIDLDLEEVNSIDKMGPVSEEPAAEPEAPSKIQDIEVRKPIDFNKVFMEPPVKISTIAHVESYADVAMDVALNSLNFKMISVMKKSGEEFGVLMKQGFTKETVIGLDDPIYQKYLSRKKSVDIRGDLTKSSYLTERFAIEDLQNLEELMIVPVVKGEEIKGIGIYGREKGMKEPTHFQKSELYNLGFLQEE